MPGLSGNFPSPQGSGESCMLISNPNPTCAGLLQTYSGQTPSATAQTQQVQQKVPGPAMSNPSLDVITSSQDLLWLLQSSLWTQPDSSWQTLASFMPHEEAISRPPAPVPGCCHARPRCPEATGRMRTKVTGRLDNKVSQEEAERRSLRRERNRMAATKCRNRRRDLTDTLQNESDQLESVQSQLQEEIAKLESEKEKLELVLEAHRPICKIADHSDDGDDDDNDTGCL
ncbi:fos-related antigen 1 [Clupea harengus]|uniref:Fos-related antigen 1 n=1 Tax=Clupea harengus TaxID=7950 RepID=A0A6P8FP17_CLUHA|nr:fos-related antigen 1 [Clupea harengus]